MRRYASVLLAASTMAVAASLHAGVYSLDIQSDGRFGDPGRWSNALQLNTDDGGLYLYYESSGYNRVTEFSGRVVQQANGPELMVFDFSSVAVRSAGLTVVGSRPAVIAATGNITLSGSISRVPPAGGYYPDGANGGGLYSGYVGQDASGIGGGKGAGGISASNYQTAGGGGGGGYARHGEDGLAGDALSAFGGLGGQPAADWSTLRPGYGGGGGGGSVGSVGMGGGMGGVGGAAIAFVTPGDLVVGSDTLRNVSINADGERGYGGEMQGGIGGAGSGGQLWFEVGGVFTNYGLISVKGGTANSGYNGGPGSGGDGSGGLIYIDPTAIYNYGMIDASGGGALSPDITGMIGLDPGATIQGDGTLKGSVTAVPEPGLLGIFIVGGILGLRRTKKAKKT